MTKRQTICLAGGVYGAVLMVCILLSLLHFAQDSIARANGTLTTHEMTFADFERQDIELLSENGTAGLTTTEDPQLVLQDLAAAGIGTVRTVEFTITFSKDPGEVTLYYAKEGEPFAKEKKVWGKRQNDGSYAFTLPRGSDAVGALRIDPTNQPNVTMQIEQFTFNAPRSFGSYFAFSYENAFYFIVYPGLAAAFLGYVITEFGPVLRKKRAAGKEGK